jgi:hypothetical protein
MFKLFSLLSLATLTLQAQNLPAPAEIVGVWSSSEVRSIMFSDRSSTTFSRPSGATIQYQINADGTYRDDTLIQTSMYNCTDTVFAQETGRVHTDGSKLVFEATGGTLRSTDNCNARFNYVKPLPQRERVMTEWLVRNGQAGPQLCMSDGKHPLCYKRSQSALASSVQK